MRHRVRVLVLLLAVGLPILVAGGYAVYWHMLAERVRTGIAAWAAARHADGLIVDYDPLVIDGFPLTLRVVSDRLSLSRDYGGQLWSWRTRTVRGEMRPWRPDELVLHLNEPHRIVVVDGGHEHSVAAQTTQTRLLLTLDVLGRPRAALLEIDNLDATVQPSDDRWALTRLKVVALRHAAAQVTAAPSLDLDVSVESLKLPERLNSPLGLQVAGAALRLDLLGTLPPDLRAASMAAWRDDGGRLLVNRADVDWGPVELRAEGHFALDKTLQPAGQLDTRLRGWHTILETLQGAGRLHDREAAIAVFALTALAKPMDDGGPPALFAPLSLSMNQVFLGPVKLVDLPPVRWPGEP